MTKQDPIPINFSVSDFARVLDLANKQRTILERKSK